MFGITYVYVSVLTFMEFTIFTTVCMRNTGHFFAYRQVRAILCLQFYVGSFFCAALHKQYVQISGQLLFNRTINQSHNNEVLYFSSGLSTVHFHSSMVMKLLRKYGKCIPAEKPVG